MDPVDVPVPDDIESLLRGVVDPELGSDIVELGMYQGATISDEGVVVLEIALTTSGCPLRGQIQRTSAAASPRSPASPR